LKERRGGKKKEGKEGRKDAKVNSNSNPTQKIDSN